MSSKATTIQKRYLKGYVTDAQLLRYKELGVITEDAYNTIYALKHPAEDEEETTEEESADK